MARLPALTSLARFAEDVRIATIFLTRLPVPYAGALPQSRITQAMGAFPVAGALVGLIGGLVYAGAWASGLPPFVAAALAVAAQVLATGAFHEDGLADAADGLGGGTTPERKLEIMRDSRQGTYGVTALVLAFALRIGAIAALADPATVGLVLIAGGAIGRAMIAAVMFALPPVRGDGRSAEAGRPSPQAAGLALVLGLLPGLALGFGPALAAWHAAALAALAMAALARRQISGQTGDVLGAVAQLSEIAFLLAALALLRP